MSIKTSLQPSSATPISFDSNLIASWDKVTDKHRCSSPSLFNFERDGKRLTYVAAHHDAGIDNPTFWLVRYAFDNYVPQSVVIEGIANTGEPSPNWYLKKSLSQESDNFRFGGESAYAAVMAHRKGIDFIPGEPTKESIYQALKEQGYTGQDLIGFLTSVSLNYLANTGNATEADLMDKAAYIERNFINIANNGNSFSFEDYTNWYEECVGKYPDMDELAHIDLSPSSGNDANFLQKMMFAEDEIREPFIMDVIAEQLSQQDRVLVIFGAAHIFKQMQALEATMGQAQDITPTLI